MIIFEKKLNPLKSILSLLFSLFSLFLAITSFAQEAEKQIIIEYSGFLSSKEKTHDGGIVFLRDKKKQIHIVHDGIDMYCDKAILYKDQNFIEAFNNVKMNQGDSIHMNSKYIEYNGKTQLAVAKGKVILREPQSVLTTDTLYFDKLKQQAFYKCGGKVERDTSGVITSTIGKYLVEQSKYQFINKVKLVNPNYILKTKQLDFYSESGHAYLYGPSTIEGDSNTIYCERGFYDTNKDLGYFVKNSKINYENRVVEGDSLFFDRPRNFASATNNIKVTDTINKSIIRGHYAEVFKDKDSVFITKRALAITVQENDSLYIHSDTLMVTGPADHRITRAFYNVKIFKSDLSGKSDSVHVDQNSGLTKMINLKRLQSSDAFKRKKKPILWNLGNQMTGDTIHFISEKETKFLDSLIVFNNAFLISKDTLGDGFNQIKGQKLIGLLEENELKNVHIIKNAEVIYYFRNSDNLLEGINKSKSGKIEIEILDNTIEDIKLINDIDGVIYPENEFPKNAKKFKGFSWREDEQPQSVSDLFKDDPPLNLPKIKGLDKPNPFDIIDFEVLDRINKKVNLRTDTKISNQQPTNGKVKPLKKRNIKSNVLKAKNQ